LDLNWSLSLSCTPFSGLTQDAATPVPVGSNGVPLWSAFNNGASLEMYTREEYIADRAINKASLDDDVGSWTWDRLRYDVKVRAWPGNQMSGEYQSVFTWSLVFAP